MAQAMCPFPSTTTPRAMQDAGRGLYRSFSGNKSHEKSSMLRSCSDNHLCCLKSRIRASAIPPKLKNSHFNTKVPLRALFYDREMSKEIGRDKKGDEIEIDEGKINRRANWIERLMELRNSWKEKQEKHERSSYVGGERFVGCDDEEGGCEVEYEDVSFDREMFSSLLRSVSWSDTKLLSQLAFLCNMAYVIPDIKTRDLRRYYGLEFVTSSLEKKAEAQKIEHDSTRFPTLSSQITNPISAYSTQKPRSRPSAAYDIAASAASYVQSQDKNIPEDDAESITSSRIYKSEMAAHVAASTMTAVVAAGEKQKEEAAKDLQSLQSSPCEWFVCDDTSIYTRCFVIQGSDSLASWQANLFFEPTKFEGMDVLVHRGIYEAAKGIYAQFLPEIQRHLKKYGERAKLQFTGHSLGGSLALLVHLMLLTRNEVRQSALFPIVNFGSPFVFCGGHRVLELLNINEKQVLSVMMHRDIVPRAFSCKYPDYVAQVLKRLTSTFRFHPCLNEHVSTLALSILAVIQRLITCNFQGHPCPDAKDKLLYSPMGKLFILQPNESSSPSHPLLPPGIGIFALDNGNTSLIKNAIRAFLNSPHPIETLSDPTAYGSDGTIMRDHDSSNYLKAINEVIRLHKKMVVRKPRKQEKNHIWPLLSSRSPHAWSHTCYDHTIEERGEVSEKILNGV